MSIELMKDLHQTLFGKSRKLKSRKPAAARRRTMSMERLESRQMMSATPLGNASFSAAELNQQSKVFEYADQWWTVMPVKTGSWLWRLDGTTWTQTYQISTNKNAQADVELNGDLAHVLLFDGKKSQVATLQFDAVDNRFEAWDQQPNLVNVTLAGKSGTIERDSTDRLWIAYNGKSGIETIYSDGLHNSWSQPITIAAGVKSSDVASITSMQDDTIGIFWSDQKTKRFGFRTHVDGAAATNWSANEVPGNLQAQNVGKGMAGDQVDVAVTSDNTLYATVKTGYGKNGYASIGMLVRRPDGAWDPFYSVSNTGANGVITVSEATNQLVVAYTTKTSGGDVVYQTSSLDTISFTSPKMLIAGKVDGVTAAETTSTDQVVFLANSKGALFTFDTLTPPTDPTPPNDPPPVDDPPPANNLPPVNNPPQPPVSPPGVSVTPLQPVSFSANAGPKPQSKIFEYAGKWWAVMPVKTGTWVWRLDGTTWTQTHQISTNKNTHADVKLDGDLAYVLLFDGKKSQVATLQYDGADNRFEAWSQQPNLVNISLAGPTGVIERDSTNRLWIAYIGKTGVEVIYSDGLHSTWSQPITLAAKIKSNEMVSIIAMPDNSIGVFWSDQKTKRFGFRTHVDGAAAAAWSANEIPGNSSALNVGGGMADDHVHLAVTSNNTVYAAIKTSYDKKGHTSIGLLVRRPNGVWDPLYTVSDSGTRGVVAVSEAANQLIVAYTTKTGGGDIVYRTSSLDTISFSPIGVVIPSKVDDVTTTKVTSSNQVVFLADSKSAVFTFDTVAPLVNTSLASDLAFEDPLLIQDTLFSAA